VRLPLPDEHGEYLALLVYVVTEPGKQPVTYDTSRTLFGASSLQRDVTPSASAACSHSTSRPVAPLTVRRSVIRSALTLS
jgi:hypothetical protein